MSGIDISVSISCVDGSSETLQTQELERARKFLKDRDHEGSSVVVTVGMENEAAYKLLALLQDYS